MDVVSYKNKVSLVMTTFNDSAFAEASLWALRRFYDLPVILADGGSEPEHLGKLSKLGARMVVLPGERVEQCANAGASMAKTPYIWFLDPDAKVTHAECLPLMLQALAKGAMETGAYGLKVVDWKRHLAFTGTYFIGHMILDGCAGYCQLHDREAFLKVGGFRFESIYDDCSDVISNGDHAITKRYAREGYQCLSPSERLPVLHWTEGSQYKHYTDAGNPMDTAARNWWRENVKHTRLDPRPLNEWERHK